ncbi:MAG: hypothetical protein SCK70_00335 [bacterium]|nr:hypothetical protein [bacterium]
MDLFFNELSLTEADHPKTAKVWLADLIKLFQISQTKECKGLKTSNDIWEKRIAPNYTIANWLTDNSVDRELRLFFKSQALKYPFIDDLIERKTEDGQRLFDFKYKDQYAKGLGAAYLFDALAISCDSSSEWDCTYIFIKVICLEDDEISETKQEVKHCSKSIHLENLNDWIRQKTKPSVPNGTILWLKRNLLFPNLVFCENVKDQLIHLNEGKPEFIQIKKRLFELEDYCQKWDQGYFNAASLPSKVTPESSTRLKKLETQLTFLCPDNNSRTFSWHSRYTRGAGRIYFFAENNQRKIFIGYIGYKIE